MGQGQHQFSRSHRGLTVLCDWELETGPYPHRRSRQVASLRPVTELVNRPRCQRGSDGFDTHTGRQSKRSGAAVAQRVHIPFVACSNHASATNDLAVLAPMAQCRRSSITRDSSVVEHSADNGEAEGSTPSPWTTRDGSEQRGCRVLKSSGPAARPYAGSSVDRAPLLQRGSRWFDPSSAYQSSVGGLVVGRQSSKLVHVGSIPTRRSRVETCV